MPFHGGHRITALSWLSAQELLVRFVSTWGNRYYYQLYAGRTLVGVSTSRTARQLVAPVEFSVWPQWMWLLAVEPPDRTTDFGLGLPPRPYNKARLSFTASGWPADTQVLHVAAGTAPGGAVDGENVVAETLFDGDGTYTLETPPLPGSGTWNFEVLGRDSRPEGGNAGTALAAAVDLLAHPPDVEPVNETSRFTAALAGGELAVSATIPS